MGTMYVVDAVKPRNRGIFGLLEFFHKFGVFHYFTTSKFRVNFCRWLALVKRSSRLTFDSGFGNLLD